jgi:hypothetical protein
MNVMSWDEKQTKERMKLMEEKTKRMGTIDSDNDVAQAEDSMDEEATLDS